MNNRYTGRHWHWLSVTLIIVSALVMALIISGFAAWALSRPWIFR